MYRMHIELAATCCRSGGTRNAEILSVWRHRERRITHGVDWRRLVGLSRRSYFNL